jgi:hypothetical protein
MVEYPEFKKNPNHSFGGKHTIRTTMAGNYINVDDFRLYLYHLSTRKFDDSTRKFIRELADKLETLKD